jgi:hypothetical protein
MGFVCRHVEDEEVAKTSDVLVGVVAKYVLILQELARVAGGDQAEAGR